MGQIGSPLALICGYWKTPERLNCPLVRLHWDVPQSWRL